jgi:hypothetical protein
MAHVSSPPSEIGLGDNRDLRGMAQGPGSDTTSDDRTDDQKKQDAELANRLSALIEDANERVVPLTKMIRKVCIHAIVLHPSGLADPIPFVQHIENMDARKEEDRNEQELVDAVKPLLIQAEKILNETQGAVKGADPEGKISNRAKRHVDAHSATPEEQRLAQALKVVSEIHAHVEVVLTDSL